MSYATYLDRYSPVRLWTVVDSFPTSWQAKLRAHLGPLRGHNYGRWFDEVMRLGDAASAGLRPDATDADIRAQAELTARDFESRINHARSRARRHQGKGPEWPDAFAALFARDVLAQRGMLDLYPAGAHMTRIGALKRLCCAKWWRRTLRTVHTRCVEACAINIGMVSRAAGLYVSNEQLHRREGQLKRSAAMLESVSAVNDMMQLMTLADIAAKGVANKAIRRVELLTRIAGFELIARDCGAIACMVTVTCPSRFHKMTTRNGRVAENRRFDGSSPREGQMHLRKRWAQCRAAAQRLGLTWYGFRIAEPQHDGTPHWHLMLFMPQAVRGMDSAVVLEALIRAYFLHLDDPHESGAREHRTRFNWIDWTRGSAVGYVIKYVAKNVDGHGVGSDLYGRDAMESARRVDAWAAAWGIRQFQQIGGAPVGVWREMRRVNPENVTQDIPEPMRIAISAVNAKGEPGLQAVAWKRYTGAQGGIGTPRAAMPIRLMGVPVEDLTVYGEKRANRITGLLVAGVELFRNHIHTLCPWTPPFQRPTVAGVESERCAWVMVTGKKDEEGRRVRRPRHEAIAYAGRVFERSGEAASTRIHVNNCTRPDPAGSDFAPRRVYRPRLRRFPLRAGEGSTASKEPPWTNPPTPQAPRAHPAPAASP